MLSGTFVLQCELFLRSDATTMEVGQEAMLQYRQSPPRQSATPEHAHSKQLPASSQAPEHTQKVLVSQGRSASLYRET